MERIVPAKQRFLKLLIQFITLKDIASEFTDVEEKELVQTIARGLIFQAQNDPHATFMMGVKGFSLDKQNGDKKLKVTKQKKHEENKNDNVIDFLEYLKKKKDGEQFEEEIQDPF